VEKHRKASPSREAGTSVFLPRISSAVAGLDGILTSEFSKGRMTLMTAEETNGQNGGLHYRFLDHMADCAVFLDLRISGQVTTRRLRVVKYRRSVPPRRSIPIWWPRGAI